MDAFEPSIRITETAAAPAAAMPFSTAANNYTPNDLWGKIKAPYPTNRWWMNFVLEGGDQPIGCLPYTTTASIDGISFFYPQPSVSDISVTMSTMSEWTVGAREGFSSRQVSAFDDMTMTYSWTSKSNKAYNMSVPFVKGSPFFTVKYNNTTPLMRYNSAKIVSATRDNAMTSMKVVLENGRVWGIYSSSPVSMYFTQSGELISSAPYSGYLRFAYFPDASNYSNHHAVLRKYKDSIPTGVSVSFVDNRIVHSYQLASTNPQEQLLMLCLPHHTTLLGNLPPLQGLSQYVTLKGSMTPVVSNTWNLAYSKLNNIGFKYTKPIPDNKKAEIQAALTSEIKNEDPAGQSVSVYFRGKELSRMARLALIADELGNTAQRDSIISNLQANLEYWLDSKLANPLRFDKTWGGICSQQSLDDNGADFGNGRYNDHYFHYGYFMYAAAVVIQLSPSGSSWYSKYKTNLDALVGDYANVDTNNQYFTRMRHMDLYDGHSWASGLYVFGLNRNQESTSEAVNAYYGAYLYALATRDSRATAFNLLLTSEILSAQFYWQTRPGNGVYNNVFSKNYIVGILWETSAQYTTWFGNNAEFIYGIQMLPFTPITFSLFDETWLNAAWPTIKARTLLNAKPMEDGWKGFMLMTGSIIEKDALLPQIRSLQSYDNGNSKTNALWWSSVC